MKKYSLSVTLLMLAMLACGLPNINVSWPTEVPQLAPTQTTTPQTNPSETPTTEFLTSPTPSFYPKGFLVDLYGNDILSFYDFEGNYLDEASTPGINTGTNGVHVAGKINDWTLSAPIVFLSFENNGALMLNQDGQVSTLVSVPSPVGIVGSPGLPIVAYSTAEYTANYGLRTRLFVGNLNTLSSASAVLDMEDPQSYAIAPLAVFMVNGSPAGIWYTYRPWGIGGDIVFDPTAGLYYLDLASGQSSEYASRDARTAHLSPDLTWAAFSTGEPGNGNLTVHNLYSGESAVFPLLAESDRGAGDAVFSPGNGYVAWMEGHGWMMAEVPDYRPTVRVATTTGTVLFNTPASSFNDYAGFEVTWVEPVGWMDEQTVLIQVRGMDGEQSAILKVDLQGRISYLAPGSFAGFVYP